MYYDVRSAEYCHDYKINILFEDGKGGVVDFQPYLQKNGVFERFKDINFFRKFYVNQEIGVLCWSDDIDIAPETLYAKATHTPLPDWITV